MATSSPKFTIRASTVIEEFENLKRVIKRLPSIKNKGYAVTLPDNRSLRDLTYLENSGEAFNIFTTTEYGTDYYKQGIEILNSKAIQLEKLVQKLTNLQSYWDFKVFSNYEILLTSYGSGGMYHHNTGKVLLLTDKYGFFRRDPLHSIIHEITHIGIEDSIVEKYSLDQSEKERLVDLMVKTIFEVEFPNYRVQLHGDSRIDAYVTSDSIKSLPDSIAQYTSIFPR